MIRLVLLALLLTHARACRLAKRHQTDAPSRAQLHNSLGDGNASQGGMEVVLIPLPDAAPTPDPALDPEPALVPDLALDPENAVLDP